MGVGSVVGREVTGHVSEVDGHVDKVVPVRAAGLEHHAHIREDGMALRHDIVGHDEPGGIEHVARNGIAARVPRADPGKEQQPGGAARMWVTTDRFRCTGGEDARGHAVTSRCPRWRMAAA
jgi:hypothetical protein